MRQFSVYQGKWSASFRDMEREIVPMVKSESMGICVWGALGGGNFKTKVCTISMLGDFVLLNVFDADGYFFSFLGTN